MRTHPFVAACIGLGILAGCADHVPTTDRAQDAESVSGRRETALHTLETGGSPDALDRAVGTLSGASADEAGIARLGRASRRSGDAAPRIAAIRVMQRWLSADPELRARAARELMLTAASRHEPMTRGLAVQAIALDPAGGWPRDVVASLGALVGSDPTGQNREIAALALGHVRGEMAGPALKSLVAAFARESDPTTRRAMLLNIVESAGPDAPRVLAGLPAGSALLRQDIADYQEILRAGVTRVPEVWERKLARDIERGTVIGTEMEKSAKE
jgi:hypothetical protein